MEWVRLHNGTMGKEEKIVGERCINCGLEI